MTSFESAAQSMVSGAKSYRDAATASNEKARTYHLDMAAAWAAQAAKSATFAVKENPLPPNPPKRPTRMEEVDRLLCDVENLLAEGSPISAKDCVRKVRALLQPIVDAARRP